MIGALKLGNDINDKDADEGYFDEEDTAE